MDTSEHKSLDDAIEMIANAVCELTQAQWSLVKIAIDKKISSRSAKIRLTDPEEIKSAIQVEMTLFK